MVTGIVCEYNPFHLGHRRQLALTSREGATVCLMSGHYVQRGEPAIVDKTLRARAAVECGADLVLELPAEVSLRSAEGFAAGAVEILAPFCDRLSFGAETADRKLLMDTAQALLTEEFTLALRRELDSGCSFPAARQKAVTAMGLRGELLATPNNILAVEYCKAILRLSSSMEPWPIFRPGDYHAAQADRSNPSAASLRERMTTGLSVEEYIPLEAARCFMGAKLHTLAAGERAVLGKLRVMTDEEFAALPYGSEGLWRKLMGASREKATLEEILEEVKSKRYTRTRLNRMILCAFLGLTEKDMAGSVPYVRVLAMNDRGREVLRLARQTGTFLNIGQAAPTEYGAWAEWETRLERLYGLFALPAPDPPTARRRPWVGK